VTVAVHAVCSPEITVAGTQDIFVLLLIFVTERDALPLEGPLSFASPGYVPWTLVVPAEVASTVTLHAPDVRSHVEPLGNATFPPWLVPCEKVISVPATGPPLITSKVQVVEEPTTNDGGAHETSTVGEALSTVIVNGAEELEP
jgi:hypothetical protein